MTEENNNQPTTTPINYEEHLDWFRVFVFIILPIQFIIELNAFYEIIRNFNEYIPIYAIIVLFSSIITIISIIIVIISSLKKKPIGYKVFWFYSIYIVSYKILGFIITYFYRLSQIDPILANTFKSAYLLSVSYTHLDVYKRQGYTPSLCQNSW